MSDIATRLTTALSDRYTVTRELGQGGMATVYLAHDIKHERDVAIKVLHPDLGASLGGERFLSEIRTTARLQHPHILPLLDSGEADGLLYYVMPLVTGETLRARLDRERQLPIADAVRIAREVASALDYAHRQNVIHRDIKPENILLHDSQAIVADFGIALAVQSAGGQRMTQTGLSLGTPQYMSPEQAMGERTIDARSDVYALGAVLYEMLSGDAPFTGGSVQAIVAKVLSERPTALHTLRDTVPTHVEQAVFTALAKLPADRPASAAAFVAMLSDSAANSAPFAVPAARDQRAVRWWQASTVLALAAAAVFWSLATRPSTSWPNVVRFSLPAETPNTSAMNPPAISPDGRVIAYADRFNPVPGIRVRWLDRDETEVLPGSGDVACQAFAPDGRSLVYGVVANPYVLRTISVDGRTSTQLATASSAIHGLGWGTDGFVYFVENTRIMRVPATGGTPTVVFALAKDALKAMGEGALRSLIMLDDGETLVSATRGPGLTDGNVVLVDIPTKSLTVLGAGNAPVGMRNGWLLYAKADGTVVAQRLDVAKRALMGAAVPVLSGVYLIDGVPFVFMAPNGTLVYQTGASGRLNWVSRAGVESEVDSTLTRKFRSLALSPANDRIAVSIEESPTSESMWLYDVTRSTLARLTPRNAQSRRPQWTPDGARLLFVSDHGTPGKRRIVSMSPDGKDTMRTVVSRARMVQEISWPARGASFAFREGFTDGATMRDIFAMEPGDTTARAVVATAADESNPAVSPDGRWLAYRSDASGPYEVYVTPFPEGGARIQLSTRGGGSPVWARDGRELYFRDAKGMIVATAMATGTANPVGASTVLFDASRYYFDVTARSFDVSRDGRFLFIRPPARATMSVVLGWWTEVEPTLTAATNRGKAP